MKFLARSASWPPAALSSLHRAPTLFFWRGRGERRDVGGGGKLDGRYGEEKNVNREGG